jgi:hypothetical protein
MCEREDCSLAAVACVVRCRIARSSSAATRHCCRTSAASRKLTLVTPFSSCDTCRRRAGARASATSLSCYAWPRRPDCCPPFAAGGYPRLGCVPSQSPPSPPPSKHDAVMPFGPRGPALGNRPSCAALGRRGAPAAITEANRVLARPARHTEQDALVPAMHRPGASCPQEAPCR